jgi:hypothetical protein
VTLSSTTPNAYICYLLADSTPALLPQTDNLGGCAIGTLYTGPVTVSSSQTLYAIADAVFAGPPSSVSKGAYSIGGP